MNKKKIIIVIVVALILIIIGFICLFLYKDKGEVINDLKIKYVGSDNISIKDVDNGYTLEKNIIIENTSDELKTYSLEWTDVDNSFDVQSNLTYEISGVGDRAASLNKSQVPGVSSKIFNQVAIKGKENHEYKIKITCNGDSKGSFNGNLKVNSKSISK